MLNLSTETPLSLKAACRLKILSRDGRPPHVSAIYRWTTRGVRGIVLETAFNGRCRVTTAEAVTRWVEALSRAADPAPPAASSASAARRRALREAERELDAAGIA